MFIMYTSLYARIINVSTVESPISYQWDLDQFPINLIVFNTLYRETTVDGRELLFDHGAPYFTASNVDVLGLVCDWESRGLVAEWKENFGSLDFGSKQFGNIEKVLQ